MDAAVLTLRITQASHGGAPVLGALEITFAAGETVAITGPSGVGKTTLLRILAGLHERFDGTVEGAATARLAMVFQEPTLLPWRSVLDNITLTTHCEDSVARDLLRAVGLGGREREWPLNLSLGQQRRLALARAFATRPTLLLMDEPFVSLDRDTADDMMAVFETLRARHPVTTVFVTHDADEASRLADRVLRLAGHPAQLVD